MPRTDAQPGTQLTERLGLTVIGTEGHDLKCACIACSSSDAMRVHQERGIAYCYSCGAKWSRLKLAEAVLGDQSEAWRLLEELGLEQPRNATPATSEEEGWIERVARIKSAPIEGLKAFGAKPVRRDSDKRRAVRFPTYNEKGEAFSYHDILAFSDNMGLNKPGKGNSGLFFPGRLPQPGETWIIVEGVKDAAALFVLGFLTCGLPGDQMAAKYARLFRDVFIIIVPDRDTAGENGAQKTAAKLYGVAASVRVATLPCEFRESKGLDTRDVLKQADGEALLRQAIDDSVVWGPEEFPEGESDSYGYCAAKDMDAAAVATAFLFSVILCGFSRLRFWQGSFWWWFRGQYNDKLECEVRAEVVNHVNRKYYEVKRMHISDVMEHVRAKSILQSAVQPPDWLDEPPHNFSPSECLATKDKVIHLPSLVDRKSPYEIDASPSFFTTTATQVDLDLEAEPPVEWLRFLASLWPDDQECIDTLQEIFGYSLTSDTRQQKIFLLVGPKRSGKGTIARVVTALVGRGNVAAPTLGGLTTNFGLWPLIGKSVAIISDARLSGRPDQAVVVERLLSISGEDSITIDRKNLQPVTCQLPTRFLILTNELPRLSDASGAITSRMILLHTTQSFYGREDHDLTDKLLAELPGIMLWAIEGWRRLRDRGRFVQPDSGLESLGEMNDLASPVSAFVRDCCEEGPSEAVPVSDLFDAWATWCKGQGRERYVGTAQSFARDLLAAVPGIRRKRIREGESRTRVYEGIGLKTGH